MQRLERELNEKSRRYRELQKTLEDCNKAIGRHQKIARDLRLQIERAQSIVNDLQDALDGDAAEEGKLEALKQQLEDAHKDKAIAENTYGDSVLEKDKHVGSLKEHTEKLNTIDIRIAAAEEKIAEAKKKYADLSDQRSVALVEKNRSIQSLQSAKEEKKDLEDQREAKVVLVADFTGHASQVGARIAVDEGDTQEILEKRYERLSADLKKYEEK